MGKRIWRYEQLAGHALYVIPEHIPRSYFTSSLSIRFFCWRIDMWSIIYGLPAIWDWGIREMKEKPLYLVKHW